MQQRSSLDESQVSRSASSDEDGGDLAISQYAAEAPNEAEAT